MRQPLPFSSFPGIQQSSVFRCCVSVIESSWNNPRLKTHKPSFIIHGTAKNSNTFKHCCQPFFLCRVCFTLNNALLCTERGVRIRFLYIAAISWCLHISDYLLGAQLWGKMEQCLKSQFGITLVCKILNRISFSGSAVFRWILACRKIQVKTLATVIVFPTW